MSMLLFLTRTGVISEMYE